MSDSPLVSVLKTVDNIKSAIELGNSTMVIADSAKLTAQIATAIAVEGFLRTYSALEGFGRTLSAWRMGEGIAGRGIEKQQALAAFAASEMVGALIDQARSLNIGGWIYDVLHPPVSLQELNSNLENLSWLLDHENGSDFYQDPENYIYYSYTAPDDDAWARFNSVKSNWVKWQITVKEEGMEDKIYQGVASPIAIDLGGDGIETTSISDHAVSFDIDGDGFKDRTAWLSGSDAFLAVDKNRNGLIDGVNELFGGLGRGDGFAKLAEFDSNGDGQVDKADDHYAELLLWQDKNMNGVSDEGEVSSASVSGLDSISTSYVSQETYQNKNLLGEVSTAVWQGKVVDTADVYFRYSPGSVLTEHTNAEVRNEPLASNQALEPADFGLVRLDTCAQALVQAMAEFAPLGGGYETLPPSYQSVTPMLAANSL